MGPMMYRQRPSYAALVSAACVLVLGTCAAFYLKRRIMAGESNSSSMVLVICLTVAITGALVITAFARYQFTHLETDPRLSRKKRKHP